MERANEVLILFKTRRDALAALERKIIEEHPYDTPEFVIVRMSAGNARYLNWIASGASGHCPPM